MNGNYAVQVTNPSLVTWAKLYACTSGNTTYSYTVTGSATVQNLSYGVASFDGIGKVTATVTQVGEANPAASANTTSIQWNSACNVISTYPGYVIDYAPTTKTYSGTYSVQSSGSGSMNLGHNFSFVLAGSNSSGTSTTLLMSTPQQSATVVQSGIAILQ